MVFGGDEVDVVFLCVVYGLFGNFVGQVGIDVSGDCLVDIVLGVVGVLGDVLDWLIGIDQQWFMFQCIVYMLSEIGRLYWFGK